MGSSSSSSLSASTYMKKVEVMKGGGWKRSQISPTTNITSSSYDYSFKFLVIGDSGVGKSSLLLTFISSSSSSHEHHHHISPTIGNNPSYLLHFLSSPSYIKIYLPTYIYSFPPSAS